MTTQRELLIRFHAAARLLSAISFIHTRWPNINGAQITEKLEPIAEALVESVAPAPSPSARAREGWEDWTAEELARELEPWPERSRAKLVAELRGARDQLRHARAFVSAWRLWLERNPHPHKEGPRLLTEMREIEAACLAPTPNAASPWVLRVRVLEAIDEAMVSNGRRARRILERLRRQFERRADGELDPRVAQWTRKALEPEPAHPPPAAPICHAGVGDHDEEEDFEPVRLGAPDRELERETIAAALEGAAESGEGPRGWQLTGGMKDLLRCLAADLRAGAAWLRSPLDTSAAMSKHAATPRDRSGWDPAAVVAFVRTFASRYERPPTAAELARGGPFEDPNPDSAFRVLCILATELEAASHTLLVKP